MQRMVVFPQIRAALTQRVLRGGRSLLNLMNIYDFELTAECPNGKLADRYECSVRANRTIQVEQIGDLVARVSEMKLYQEDIADLIRNELQASVTLTGWHYGVKVTCLRQ